MSLSTNPHVRRPRPRHAPLPALRHPRRREARRASRRARAASSIPSCSGRRSRRPSASSIRGCSSRTRSCSSSRSRPCSSRSIALGNATGLDTDAAKRGGLGFQVQIAIWLWFTVLFATYAEAVAEARGRAQAATLRKTRSETIAHRRLPDGTLEDVGSSELRKGDIIVVERGRDDPRRRRRHRGRRLRQRGGHHGRVGAGPQGAGHRHPELA